MRAPQTGQRGGNAFLRGADIGLDAPFGAPPPPLSVREVVVSCRATKLGREQKTRRENTSLRAQAKQSRAACASRGAVLDCFALLAMTNVSHVISVVTRHGDQMIFQMWRLSESGDDNFGLACIADGPLHSKILVLLQPSLVATSKEEC